MQVPILDVWADLHVSQSLFIWFMYLLESYFSGIYSVCGGSEIKLSRCSVQVTPRCWLWAVSRTHGRGRQQADTEAPGGTNPQVH